MKRKRTDRKKNIFCFDERKREKINISSHLIPDAKTVQTIHEIRLNEIYIFKLSLKYRFLIMTL